MNGKCGFSLVEVLLALAILGASITFIIDIQQDLNKAKTSIAVSLDKVIFTKKLVTLIDSPPSCQNFIGKTPTDGLELNELCYYTDNSGTKGKCLCSKNKKSQATAGCKTKFGRYMELSKISLKHVNTDTSNKVEEYEVVVNVDTRNSFPTKAPAVPISFQLDSAGKVSNCSPSPTSPGGSNPGGSNPGITKADICSLFNKNLDTTTGKCVDPPPPIDQAFCNKLYSVELNVPNTNRHVTFWYGFLQNGNRVSECTLLEYYTKETPFLCQPSKYVTASKCSSRCPGIFRSTNLGPCSFTKIRACSTAGQSQCVCGCPDFRQLKTQRFNR